MFTTCTLKVPPPQQQGKVHFSTFVSESVLYLLTDLFIYIFTVLIYSLAKAITLLLFVKPLFFFIVFKIVTPKPTSTCPSCSQIVYLFTALGKTHSFSWDIYLLFILPFRSYLLQCIFGLIEIYGVSESRSSCSGTLYQRDTKRHFIAQTDLQNPHIHHSITQLFLYCRAIIFTFSFFD